jgi:hypothetical protein
LRRRYAGTSRSPRSDWSAPSRPRQPKAVAIPVARPLDFLLCLLKPSTISFAATRPFPGPTTN